MGFPRATYFDTRDIQAAKDVKKLTGNTDIEDSLERLDKLTQEEVRIASAELLKITHSVDDRVRDVGNKIQSVDDRVQGIGGDITIISSEV